MLNWFPYKIVKNPKIKPVDRTFPLEKFYTFKNGKSVYTFRPSDLSQISGRYLDKTKATISFLVQYGATKEMIEKYEQETLKVINQGLNAQMPQGEALAMIKQMFEERKTLHSYNKDLNRQLWLDMYCMFFVLDGEIETKWSPNENAEKIELLNTLPDEEQEFFFRYLQTIMTNYSATLKQDIMNYINQTAQEHQLMDYLTGAIEKLSTKYSVPSLQELTLITSEAKASKQGTT